jgi:hypothetical protein
VARPAAHQTAVSLAIRSLAAAPGPACLLDPSGSILFVNETWDRHAFANGGAPGCLGSSLIATQWLDHIRGEEVRRGYAQLLDRALHLRAQRPQRVTQFGESNTATRAALVATHFEPVLAHGGDVIAVAIAHEVVRERAIEEVYDVSARPAESYCDGEGRVTQCSCCRRARDPAEPSRWDLVPALIAAPPRAATVHVLCELCAELHCVVREDER